MWIGRPVLWGLAYKGQAGVELCLKLLTDEIKLCMALAGTTSVRDITKEYLVKVSCQMFDRMVRSADSGFRLIRVGSLRDCKDLCFVKRSSRLCEAGE